MADLTEATAAIRAGDVELRVDNYVLGDRKDATTVLLSDDGGAYGVKRLDTGAAVVADGTAMTKASTGEYRYEFTAPALNLDYVAAFEITQTDGRVDLL